MKELNNISSEDYDAAEWVLVGLVSSIQMIASLRCVESDDDVNVDYWTNMLSEKLQHYLEDRR